MLDLRRRDFSGGLSGTYAGRVPALRDATVTMPDGRGLAYTEWGRADGKPILFFHGTPGCRLWCPDEKATDAARVRLIIPDRPGTGRSDPLEGRTLAACPGKMWNSLLMPYRCRLSPS